MQYNIVNFATRLRAIRKSCHMKQSDVHTQLNVSPTTYTAWETGKKYPTIEKLEELATLFNTTPTFLLTGDASDLDMIKLSEAIVSASSFFEIGISDKQLAKFAKLIVLLYNNA